MVQASDFWTAVFVEALDRYGEERAAGVADRGLKEFEKRFSAKTSIGGGHPVLAEEWDQHQKPAKLEDVKK